MRRKSVQIPLLAYLDLGAAELEIVGNATYAVFPDSFGVRGSEFINVDLVDYELGSAFYYHGGDRTSVRPAQDLLFFLRLCFPGIASAINAEIDNHLAALEGDAQDVALALEMERDRYGDC